MVKPFNNIGDHTLKRGGGHICLQRLYSVQKLKRLKTKLMSHRKIIKTPVTTRNKMRNNTDTQFIDFNDHY